MAGSSPLFSTSGHLCCWLLGRDLLGLLGVLPLFAGTVLSTGVMFHGFRLGRSRLVNLGRWRLFSFSMSLHSWWWHWMPAQVSVLLSDRPGEACRDWNPKTWLFVVDAGAMADRLRDRYPARRPRPHTRCGHLSTRSTAFRTNIARHATSPRLGRECPAEPGHRTATPRSGLGGLP